MQPLLATLAGGILAATGIVAGTGIGAATGTAAPAPPMASGVSELDHEVVSRRPHDPDAWTQGLQLDDAGRLFESTGLLGRSTIREVDPISGQVLRLARLPDDAFGEGIAIVGDRLVQLTWQSGEAFTWEVETFEPRTRLAYEGEGWGLCHDGVRLIMSDGSASLAFRDPATFALEGRIEVTLDGAPAGRLNELECVGRYVWANAYPTDRILRIDPAAGRVTGILDLSDLAEPHTREEPSAILNGIAWDARAGTFLVTGKRWPEMVEIRIVDPIAG